MAYNRDDRWRGRRDEQYRGGEGHDRPSAGRRDERGFLERAGDEIASWFGDEETERRRMREDDDRRGYGSHRDEDRTYQPMDWATSDRDYRSGGYDRDFNRDRGYSGDGRPERGERDYGRSSEWQRDPYRRTSFAGSSVGSNYEDQPYDEWRHRHMADLDRDYDEYCRERQSRFESDFGEWRERREGKRRLLGQIREHMEVVGRDGEHVGTVDRTAGDKLILTRSDPESGGVHHSISCTMIDRIEGDRVMLDLKAEQARERWRDEDRDRALFEREDQGQAGPGMLNRSFSGTYR